jgi:hypothetical protein
MSNIYTPQMATCKVKDPTGTPLNVRTKPRTGKVVSKLKNGTTVYVEDYADGADPANVNSSVWAKISVMKSGKRKVLGWVTNNFLVCE